MSVTEKTIHDEEINNVDAGDMVADLKVIPSFRSVGSELTGPQNKLELQYAAKRDTLLSEVTDLKQQLEIRHNETRSLNATIDSLKSVNEELKVNNFVSCLQVTDAFDIARICCDVCWNWRW